VKINTDESVNIRILNFFHWGGSAGQYGYLLTSANLNFFLFCASSRVQKLGDIRSFVVCLPISASGFGLVGWNSFRFPCS
jgi:hypothetical protein